ncbi:MAG: ABC transporter substrate-binding protein [Desulfurococcaceae archaeon]
MPKVPGGVSIKIISLIIVVLLIAGILAFFIYSNLSMKPEATSTTPITTPITTPTTTPVSFSKVIVVSYSDPNPIDRVELVPYSNINPGFLKDPVMEALIQAGRYTADPDLRRILYEAIQKLSNDRLSLIWLVQARDVRVYWDWIKGIYFHPTLAYRIDDLRKDPKSPNPTTLVIGESEEGHSLDPAVTYWGFDWFILHQIYERLVTYELDITDYVIPCLAVAWAHNYAGDEWYFVIRGGVSFYDPWSNRTIPLTPEDVIYSLKRVAVMHLDPSWLIDTFIDVEKSKTMSQEEFSAIASTGLKTEFKGRSGEVHSLSELLEFFNYTGDIAGFIKLKLYSPYAAILQVLATIPASIVSMEVVEAHGGIEAGKENKYMYDHPVGTGPYYLVEWVHKQYYRLRANPYYWRGKPSIEEVLIKLIPEDSTRIMELKKGDLDIALVPPTLVEQVKGVSIGVNKLIVEVAPSFLLYHLTLNCEKAPFNNDLFRKALAWAVPYDSIISAAFNNLAEQAYGVIPKGMFGYQDSYLVKYAFNPAEAQKLLAASRIDPRSVDITIIVPQGYSELEQIATLVQASWSQVLGISVKVQVLSRPVFNEKLSSGDFDVQVLAWGPDYADPDDYAGPLQAGGYTFSSVEVHIVSSINEAAQFVDLSNATQITLGNVLIIVGEKRS